LYQPLTFLMPYVNFTAIQ